MIAGEMTKRSRDCGGRGGSNSCIWGEIIIVREGGGQQRCYRSNLDKIISERIQENRSHRAGEVFRPGYVKFLSRTRCFGEFDVWDCIEGHIMRRNAISQTDRIKRKEGQDAWVA